MLQGCNDTKTEAGRAQWLPRRQQGDWKGQTQRDDVAARQASSAAIITETRTTRLWYLAQHRLRHAQRSQRSPTRDGLPAMVLAMALAVAPEN
mmetsp:Transcript_8077/g.22490  ORF Transcript_8077/g.22490 Transcript_8077/m.22490 type:complete len:93 (-) Transcript_8077:3390-3668(-)